MKYVLIIPDGAADEAQPELGGRTPLEAALTPNLDRLAQAGSIGRANHTPANLPPGSDVACLSLLGYDPIVNYSGRAPLEAVAHDILLSPSDWVIRCNLVTVREQQMEDFTAGHVTSEEAQELLKFAQGKLPSGSPLSFFPGVSYRNLLVYRPVEGSPAPFSDETRATPPHDLTGKAITDDFPRGPGSQVLSELMSESVDWFAKHPVNRRRIAQGKPPITNVWLWGLGQSRRLPLFLDRYKLRGAMITAVDLLRGLAKLIGWECIPVKGATGYLDTDYAAKGRAAIEALDKFDFVCVHVEAPDEASHQGDAAQKIASIEAIDGEIIGPLVGHLSKLPAWRILVSPDHPTLIATKTHVHGEVPYVMSGAGINPSHATKYCERIAAESAEYFERGHELMARFLS